MLVLVCALLALAVPLAVRHDLAALGRLRLRGGSLIWGALAIQVVMVYAPVPGPAAVGLHLTSYTLAAVAVWWNRRLRGVPVVGLGAALNAGTIALNGGTLPARAGAVAAAGLDDDGGFVNSGVLPDPVLPWLGDVFAWPEPLPLANVFSVGDVLVVLGVLLLGLQVSSRRPTPVETPRIRLPNR